MVFEEVKEKDQRKFGEYYKEKLKSNLLIIDAIINKEPFKPRTIKLLLFLINIDLYLFLNALFMNEELVSEIFNSEENGIFDIILRSWDRIFYTTFVKIIVNYLIDCL